MIRNLLEILRKFPEPSAIIIAAILTGIFTVLAAYISLRGNGNSGNDLSVPTTDAVMRVTDTMTKTPIPTPTVTPQPTLTPTSTSTSTSTKTTTPTNTATTSPTSTDSPTSTRTPMPTSTSTQTETPSPTNTLTSTPTSTPLPAECGLEIEDTFVIGGENKIYSVELEPGNILNATGVAAGDYLEFGINVYSPYGIKLGDAEYNQKPSVQTGRVSERGEYSIVLSAPELSAGFFTLYVSCILDGGVVMDSGGYVQLTPTPTQTPRFTLTKPTSTPRPTSLPSHTRTPTPVPGTYPCYGTIKSTSSHPLFVVYSRPNSRQSPIDSVMPAEEVRVLDTANESGRIWYQIEFDGGQSLGWVWNTYVQLLDNCP